MTSLEVLISELGYEEEEAKVLLDKKNLVPTDGQVLEERIKVWRALGLRDKEIKKMAKSFPKIFSYNTKKILDFRNYLGEKFDYEEKDFITLVTSNPRLISRSLKKIDQSIQIFKEAFMAESKDADFKLDDRWFSLIGKNIDQLIEKRDFLKKNLGFTDEEVLNLISDRPAILSTDEKDLEQTIEAIKQIYGTTDIIKTESFIMCPRGADLKFRYALFYTFTGNTNFTKRKYYSQNSKISFARFCDLLKAGRTASYATVLYSENEYKKKVGPSNSLLLEKYPLNEEEVEVIIDEYNKNFPDKPLNFSEEEKRIILGDSPKSRRKSNTKTVEKEIEEGEMSWCQVY